MFLKDLVRLSVAYDWFGKRSYSQSGEDVLVDSILGRPKKGFYLDIGAFHPKLFSNTYLFYKRGWSGVCVEPNPEAKWKFGLVRARDKFVNMGVIAKKNQGSELSYFVFDEEATNTFSEEVAEENKGVGRKLLKKINIPVMEVNSLLKRYVPQKQKIDLLSIDVEGMDEEILKSIDWEKWKPTVVVCEEIRSQVSGLRSQMEKFFKEKGYEMVGKTGYSVIYRKIR